MGFFLVEVWIVLVEVFCLSLVTTGNKRRSSQLICFDKNNRRVGSDPARAPSFHYLRWGEARRCCCFGFFARRSRLPSPPDRFPWCRRCRCHRLQPSGRQCDFRSPTAHRPCGLPSFSPELIPATK